MITLNALAGDYERYVENFYRYLPDGIRKIFTEDALYHKKRYLDMLEQPFFGCIVEVGSDKPFITHCLKSVFHDADIHTISIDLPYSPYPIARVDIESEHFPFPDNSVDHVIFTEVLEHLFRDPAFAIAEINRILKVGGTLFLTTPNACGYDVLRNIFLQKNPNSRNQFYLNMESGHPHLWTGAAGQLLLEQHGFVIRRLSTVNYYEIPFDPSIEETITKYSVNRDLHGQVLRILAEKRQHSPNPVYPTELFPEGKPVQFEGALRKWIESR